MTVYTIPRPKVVYEVLNSEVIVVDFNTGNYYALLDVAKEIWQLIEKEVPPERIARLLSDHYKVDIERVLHDVRQFFEELLQNGLIELSCGVESVFKEEDPIQIPFSEGRYDAPKLQTYTDVQNLLLLDPIHEVSEVGWPEPLN